MSNHHALVCGASSGIGAATALEFAKRGLKVTLLARSRENLQVILEEIKSQVPSSEELIDCIAQDLEDLGSLRSEVKSLIEKNGPVHILINNSSGPPSGPLLQAEPEDFLSPMRRHLMASHMLVKLLLPGMYDEQFGRIINVISTSVREPIPNLGVSNTIRGAMAAWAKSLSIELPQGVTINNVLPGFTNTPRLEQLKIAQAKSKNCEPEEIEKNWLSMIPEGRLAEPGETAKAIAFLASEDAAYIRGVSLAVDGGRLKSI